MIKALCRFILVFIIMTVVAAIVGSVIFAAITTTYDPNYGFFEAFWWLGIRGRGTWLIWLIAGFLGWAIWAHEERPTRTR